MCVIVLARGQLRSASPCRIRSVVLTGIRRQGVRSMSIKQFSLYKARTLSLNNRVKNERPPKLIRSR